MIRGAIFDLDGTLVDSMWMWKQIDREFLGKFQIPVPDNLQKEIEGMSFSETAGYFKKRFPIPLSPDEIKQAWNDMAFHKYTYEVPLKPGVDKFLEYLSQNGIKMGIATSNSRELVDAVTDALNIRHYFTSITTACEVATGKPAPDIYYKVAADLRVEPSECVVFEDVPAGIMAGKNAGMRVYAVEDEFSSHMRREKQMLADGYLVNYQELINQGW